MDASHGIADKLLRMLELMEAYGGSSWNSAVTQMYHASQMSCDISASYRSICGGMGSFSDFVLPLKGDTQNWSEDMSEFDKLRGEVYEQVYEKRYKNE